MSAKRKQVSHDTKVQILKSYLTGKKSISDLSEEYGVAPSSIYQWQNHLFNMGSSIFERKNDRRTGQGAVQRYEKKIAELEAKLSSKNEVLSEVMEEMVKLKKSVGEI